MSAFVFLLAALKVASSFSGLQLQLFGHLHVVIKEHAHKCNPYFDPIDLSILRYKLDQVSHFQVARKGRNAEYACSCRNTASCMHL